MHSDDIRHTYICDAHASRLLATFLFVLKEKNYSAQRIEPIRDPFTSQTWKKWTIPTEKGNSIDQRIISRRDSVDEFQMFIKDDRIYCHRFLTYNMTNLRSV